MHRLLRVLVVPAGVGTGAGRGIRPVVRIRRDAAAGRLVSPVPRPADRDAAEPRRARVRSRRPRDVPHLGEDPRPGRRRRDAAAGRAAAGRGARGHGAGLAEAGAGGRQPRGPRRAAHPPAPAHPARIRLHPAGPAGDRRVHRDRSQPDAAGGSRLRRDRHGGGEPEHVAAARAQLPGGGRPGARCGHRDRAAAALRALLHRLLAVAVPLFHRHCRAAWAGQRQEARRRLRAVLRLHLHVHLPQQLGGLRRALSGPLPGHDRRLPVPGVLAGNAHGVPREPVGRGRVARRSHRIVRPGGSAHRRADAVPAPGPPHRRIAR